MVGCFTNIIKGQRQLYYLLPQVYIQGRWTEIPKGPSYNLQIALAGHCYSKKENSKFTFLFWNNIILNYLRIGLGQTRMLLLKKRILKVAHSL